MTSKKGLNFSKSDPANAALGREFFDSPEAFASKRGLAPEDLVCPESAHAAMKRGYAFAAAADGRAFRPSSESMKELGGLATKHFGKDFRVEMIPFGLRFSEPAMLAADDPTGSGTVTFLDADGDVDEMLE